MKSCQLVWCLVPRWFHKTLATSKRTRELPLFSLGCCCWAFSGFSCGNSLDPLLQQCCFGGSDDWAGMIRRVDLHESLSACPRLAEVLTVQKDLPAARYVNPAYLYGRHSKDVTLVPVFWLRGSPQRLGGLLKKRKQTRRST